MSCNKDSVVAFTSTETLCNKKSFFPLIAWSWGYLYSQIGKKFASWCVHQAQGFDRDGRKEVLTTNAAILFLLARSDNLRCSTCLAGGPSDVGFSQWACDGYVLAQWIVALYLWYSCITILEIGILIRSDATMGREANVSCYSDTMCWLLILHIYVPAKLSLITMREQILFWPEERWSVYRRCLARVAVIRRLVCRTLRCMSSTHARTHTQPLTCTHALISKFR